MGNKEMPPVIWFVLHTHRSSVSLLLLSFHLFSLSMCGCSKWSKYTSWPSTWTREFSSLLDKHSQRSYCSTYLWLRKLFWNKVTFVWTWRGSEAANVRLSCHLGWMPYRIFNSGYFFPLLTCLFFIATSLDKKMIDLLHLRKTVMFPCSSSAMCLIDRIKLSLWCQH